MTLQLTDDRRCRVRRELEAAIGVEPVDRFQQADGRDLDQVVERLAAVGEPSREVLGQTEVSCDELVAQRGVARRGVVGELLAELGPLIVVEGHRSAGVTFPETERRAARSRPSVPGEAA